MIFRFCHVEPKSPGENEGDHGGKGGCKEVEKMKGKAAEDAGDGDGDGEKNLTDTESEQPSPLPSQRVSLYFFFSSRFFLCIL